IGSDPIQLETHDVPPRLEFSSLDDYTCGLSTSPQAPVIKAQRQHGSAMRVIPLRAPVVRAGYWCVRIQPCRAQNVVALWRQVLQNTRCCSYAHRSMEDAILSRRSLEMKRWTLALLFLLGGIIGLARADY